MRPTARLAGALVLLGALACAPKQRIPLECVPEQIEIYLDGELLEDLPSELELRSDRHHVLLLKANGYQPELVVLETRDEDGEWSLSPSELCVRPILKPTQREVDVEIERDAEE